MPAAVAPTREAHRSGTVSETGSNNKYTASTLSPSLALPRPPGLSLTDGLVWASLLTLPLSPDVHLRVPIRAEREQTVQ